jgi:hypothetical protein
MNKSALSSLRAKELVEEKVLPPYQTNIQRAKENIERGKQLQSECDLKMSQFTSLKKAGNPRAASLYRELEGEWAKGEDYWTKVAPEQLPLCRKASIISNQAMQQLQKSEQELDEQNKQSQNEGGEIIFLKKQHPELFNTYFTEDEQLKSGIDSVRLAMKSFSSKLLHGDWSSLGFSIFSFYMSLLTSIVAVLLTITYSHRKDVAQSYDQKILNAREKFFNSVRRGILKKQQNTQPPNMINTENIIPYLPINYPTTNGKHH